MQSGQQFITLVPADAPLEVEANIFGRDSGFVHVGNTVVVKFDTFPYSQYGMAEGTVKIVSPDSFTAAGGGPQPNKRGSGRRNKFANLFIAREYRIDRVALHDVPEGFPGHARHAGDRGHQGR